MTLSVSDGYIKGKKKYDELRNKYTAVGTERETEDTQNLSDEASIEAANGHSILPADAPDRISVDFESLCRMNPDVVAWLYIPAVEISYPVVQGEDNEYYLHRSLEQEYLFAGCLFLDAYNSPDFTNYNSIIYGHNMRDGSMFARLKEFNDPDMVKECPYFWLLTPEADYLYKIFSVHLVLESDAAYTVRFGDFDSYREWCDQMKEDSGVEIGADAFTSDQRIVTLSTCTSSEYKQLVQGVRTGYMKR